MDSGRNQHRGRAGSLRARLSSRRGGAGRHTVELQEADMTEPQMNPADPAAATQQSRAPGQAVVSPQDSRAGRQPGRAAGAVNPFMPMAGRSDGRLWIVAAAAAVVFLAVGVMLLVWPNVSLTVIAILIGAALVVAGLRRLWDGFTDHSDSSAMRVGNVILGLLAIVVGLYCLRHHALTLLVVAFVVGVFWIIQGITDIAVAASMGTMPGRGLLAVTGVFALGAGLITVFWPAITVLVLAIVLGIWLVFYGIMLAAMAFQLRRAKSASAGQAGLAAA